MDDAPPPPYTETDIYSHSGGRSPAVPSPHSTTPNDDSASRISSSNGDAIFTPPLTPRTDAAFAHQEPNPSAVAYFDSRPPPSVVPSQHIIHSLSVEPTSAPSSFPYSQFAANLTVRDVTPQDWQTFINFLLPDHDARDNEAVVDRKLRAEAETSEDGSARPHSHAGAQLDQIRTPVESSGRQRRDAERTIVEWNEGFFEPRGITIRLNPAAEEGRMPGSWDRSFDHTAHAGAGESVELPPRPCNHNRGFSWGGITVNDNGVSIGNTLVADKNGLRMGNLFSYDRGGVGFGHNNMFGPRGQPGPFGSWGYGRNCHSGGGEPWQHRGFGGGDHHGRGRRGQGRRHSDPRPQRSPSCSSSSSSSSSDTSIGSLPDYDDLQASQFPIVTSAIRSWLASPTHITKQDIKQLKATVRSLKHTQAQLSATEKQAQKKELKQLFNEFRQAKRQQKQERKQLKREKRERKKAEKREKRGVKKELNRTKREFERHMKRTAKEIEKSKKEIQNGFNAFRIGPHPDPIPTTVPAMPPHPLQMRHAQTAPMPPIPPVPPVEPAAPVAPAPPVPPAFGFGRPLPFGRSAGFWGSRGFGGDASPGGGPVGLGGFGRHDFSNAHGFGRPTPPAGPVPGSWPESPQQAGPHHRSWGQYQALEGLQRRLEMKEAELRRVVEAKTAEKGRDEARRSGCGSGRGSRGRCGRSGGAIGDGVILALEKEIEGLGVAVERLKLEADEEFAREVAETEDPRLTVPYSRNM